LYQNNYILLKYKMDAVKTIESQVMSIAPEFRDQSLNAVVAGFAFASAIAWMDAVRWFISSFVKVSKNGGSYYLLTALLTTLLSIVVYIIVSRLSKNVKKPSDTVYAVTA